MVPSSPTFLSFKAKPPANIFNFRSSYQFERAIRRTISRRTIWLAIVIDKFFSVPRYAEKAHDRPTGRSFSCGNPNFLFGQLQRNSSIAARMQSPSKQYSVAASYSSNFFQLIISLPEYFSYDIFPFQQAFTKKPILQPIDRSLCWPLKNSSLISVCFCFEFTSNTHVSEISKIQRISKASSIAYYLFVTKIYKNSNKCTFAYIVCIYINKVHTRCNDHRASMWFHEPKIQHHIPVFPLHSRPIKQ